VKMLAMLVALLIVGSLVYKQMNPVPVERAEGTSPRPAGSAPTVPTSPSQVKQFSSQMNDYVQAEADKRAAAMEAEEAR